MPKRSVDYGRKDSMSLPSDKMQNKTERSHEENQERAYIAASRRADRSLEARVQSARMASEIHKKRTGKGFRISEEIVMKEEMYEEEEDSFPRSYRLLGPHMQTASPEMNSRVEAYLTNKVAMSRLVANSNDEWRQNEINKLFAQSFPNARKQAEQMTQQLSNPTYPGQQSQGSLQQNPVSPTFQNINYHQDGSQPHQSMSPVDSRPSAASHSPTMNLKSPPHSGTPVQPMMDFDTTMAETPSHDFGGENSVFTSELPAEAKMLLGGFDMSDPFGQNLYAQDWTMPESMYQPSGDAKMGEMDPALQHQMFSNEPSTLQKWDQNEAPTTGMEEPAWDSFLNDNAWVGEQ